MDNLIYSLHMEWQTQQIYNTCLKPDGYMCGYKGLPLGIGTSLRFYPKSLWSPADIYFTHLESCVLPSLVWLAFIEGNYQWTEIIPDCFCSLPKI
jgi:hypothetical protein